MESYRSIGAGRGGPNASVSRAVGWMPLSLVCAAIAIAWPFAQSLAGAGPVRIFVVQSDSWSFSGKNTERDGIGAGSLSGGAKPQTAETMKTISKRAECQGIVVTINRDNADYILMLERVGGRGVVQKDNKMALFRRDGDMIASSSTRSLGNAVKDACIAIQGD